MKLVTSRTYIADNGEKENKIGVTRPNMEMSIAQLVYMHDNGIPTPRIKNGAYTGDILLPEGLDPIQVEEALRDEHERIMKLQKDLNEIQERRSKAAKEHAEKTWKTNYELYQQAQLDAEKSANKDSK